MQYLLEGNNIFYHKKIFLSPSVDGLFRPTHALPLLYPILTHFTNKRMLLPHK